LVYGFGKRFSSDFLEFKPASHGSPITFLLEPTAEIFELKTLSREIWLPWIGQKISFPRDLLHISSVLVGLN
jgi:hypothetical protein